MKTRRMIIAGALFAAAATLAGCFWYGRPCHNECWWDHGRRLCERRCN